MKVVELEIVKENEEKRVKALEAELVDIRILKGKVDE